jgi:hypothetical protein
MYRPNRVERNDQYDIPFFPTAAERVIEVHSNFPIAQIKRIDKSIIPFLTSHPSSKGGSTETSRIARTLSPIFMG